jgi:hypothetical protein
MITILWIGRKAFLGAVLVVSVDVVVGVVVVADVVVVDKGRSLRTTLTLGRSPLTTKRNPKTKILPVMLTPSRTETLFA